MDMEQHPIRRRGNDTGLAVFVIMLGLVALVAAMAYRSGWEHGRASMAVEMGSRP